MKLANSMLILAFGIAGSDSQSPTTIEMTPNESPTMTHSTIIHAQNMTTKRYLKVTSKSEKTSNSGKSSRTTSNSAKSSKSENRKSETKKKPPSIAPPLEITETTNKPKQCPAIPQPCVKKPRPCPVPPNKIVIPPKKKFPPPTKDEFPPPTKNEKDCSSGTCGVQPSCSKSKSGKSKCDVGKSGKSDCGKSKSGKSECGDYQPSCKSSKSDCGKSKSGVEQASWDGSVRKLGKEAWEADSASGGDIHNNEISYSEVIVHPEDMQCYIIDSVCPCIDIEQVTCPPVQPKKKPVCKGDGTSGCSKSPTKKPVVKPTASPVSIVEIEQSMSMSMSMSMPPSESPIMAYPTPPHPVTKAPSTTAPTCYDDAKSGKAWYGEAKSGKAKSSKAWNSMWYSKEATSSKTAKVAGVGKSGKIFKSDKANRKATPSPSVFVTEAIGPVERAPLSYWAGEWEPKNRRQLERRRLV